MGPDVNVQQQLVNQVFQHLALTLFALVAVAIGCADLWHFHEVQHDLGAWVDLALIMAGLAAGGVQVSGVLPKPPGP